MLNITEIPVSGYEKVIEVINKKAKLHCFIALHNLSQGPALGGVRIYPYATREAALEDVLRLAKGMTYKSALAEDGLGGGKSVIIANPHTDKTNDLLLAFADAINTLQGNYITAEDVGSTPEDLMIIRQRTPFVSALPIDKSSGDPSRFTAWGVFKGIQAVAQNLWHSTNLRGKRIAIQGLGHVGAKLAELLFWEGAELVLSDLDRHLLHHLATIYGAQTVSSHEFHRTKCDILSPCAMGGTINDETIPRLQCKAIAGSANNQLGRPEHGFRLKEKGILYAPDSIINSGGIINAAAEFDEGGYNPKTARDKVDRIYDRLLTLFNKAEMTSKPPSQLADELAEYNLKNKIGARTRPIDWS
jgi:leucine dehydrogenase